MNFKKMKPRKNCGEGITHLWIWRAISQNGYQKQTLKAFLNPVVEMAFFLKP